MSEARRRPDDDSDFSRRVREAIQKRIKNLLSCDRDTEVPKKGGTFLARWENDGVVVNNLAGQPCLKWDAFYEAVNVVWQHGTATRGNAMKHRLGEPDLPLDSIEGWVAFRVYQKGTGDSVFRRSVPLIRILEAAGILTSFEGDFGLTDDFGREINPR